MAKHMLFRGMLASLLVAGTSCAALAQSADGPPVDGGTAVIAVGGDLKALNPTINTDAGVTAIGCMIHDGLVAIKNDGSYEPSLAKSWTISPDGKTYTFELAEAKWHDGKPFTSKDVEYFMTKVVTYAPLIASQVGKKIVKVEPMGDHKISVTLSEPFGPFLRMLACFNGGAIIPEHIYRGTEPAANQASNAPIGTGPFKFVEWRSGESIRLAKNENYWRTKVHLDGIVVRMMPNPGTRTQALKAGEVDFIARFYLPTSDIATIKADPKLKLVESGSLPNMLMGFLNVKVKPLDNKKVRQALFSVI
ncbi:MAG: ABC transporter substrate-binding protein, partial [Dehalococcoidia bacterium]